MPRIGSSDLHVFPLALGGNVFGWTADESDLAPGPRRLHGRRRRLHRHRRRVLRLGDGNSGGESETVIGSWFAASGKRDDVTIATKVSQHPEFPGLSADNVAKGARASLQRLGTDRIDLYYAHFDDQDTPLEETVRAFDQLVQEGLVRYTAISNYSTRARRRVDPHRRGERPGPARRDPAALQPRDPPAVRVGDRPARSTTPASASCRTSRSPPGSSRASTAPRTTSPARTARARSPATSPTPGSRVVDALEGIATAHDVEIATVALAWLQAQPDVVAPIASARATPSSCRRSSPRLTSNSTSRSCRRSPTPPRRCRPRSDRGP